MHLFPASRVASVLLCLGPLFVGGALFFVGLAAVRGIVQAHGGTITAQSGVGHGHFTIVLPLDPEEVDG